jgi:GT2 family glycosyltransferase
VTAAPVISVITTVRDGERSLPALFAALDGQTLGRARFEAVVIDNASRDRTAEAARAWGATVVAEPVPGRARARNRGVGVARAPLLAFTDADCRPRADWLERLVPALHDAPLVGGPVVVTTSAEPNAVERLEALWRFRQEDDVRDGGWSATANLGMRREAFEAIRGFDAALPHIGEDVDLCLRAGEAGHPLAWCPDAVVEHPAETELRPLLRRAYEHAFSMDALHVRYGLAPDRSWRHPRPLVHGDWALRRFGVELAAVPASQRRAVLRTARLEYAARMIGSARGRIARRSAAAARWPVPR